LPSDRQELARLARIDHLDRQVAIKKLAHYMHAYASLNRDGLHPFDTENSKNVCNGSSIRVSNGFEKDGPSPVDETNCTFSVASVNANPVISIGGHRHPPDRIRPSRAAKEVDRFRVGIALPIQRNA
tara:strand:+ start:1267 stop:1647 length:381 start_codon:yes stop_codon:yes gene_type:complete